MFIIQGVKLNLLTTLIGNSNQSFLIDTLETFKSVTIVCAELSFAVSKMLILNQLLEIL